MAKIEPQLNTLLWQHNLQNATDGKNGTVDSVHRTTKLCCYSNTLNRGHAVFTCQESTLSIHSENPFMMSNLTTGNSVQLKMSPKFRPSQKRRFWIWPSNVR